MNDCCKPCCFEDSISGCPETIKVNAKLTAATTYNWIITDYHGNKYSQEFTTNADGYGTISTESLPDGFCNPASAGFTIEVKKILTDSEVVPLVFPVSYECIKISNTGGDLDKSEIGNTIT